MHLDPAPATSVGAVLSAVHAFDQAELGTILDEAHATHGLDLTLDEVVLPALRLVGTLCASGTMDIAHEHLLSTAVARWVAVRSALQPRVARRGTILLAAGPEDMHTLALDCLDLLLSSRGVRVCNLGARTPVASLLVAAAAVHPTAVVLSSQTATVGSDAVRSVEAMADAGVPVYLARASFVLQHFRRNAPGIPLDASLRESAELLTVRHTTPLPAVVLRRTGRRELRAVVARAVAVAREVQVLDAARSVVSTRHAAEAAATAVALAAAEARADRTEAARAAAEAVAGRAGRVAAEVRRQADESAVKVREAAARAATAAAATSRPEGRVEAAATALRLAATVLADERALAEQTAATAARVAHAVATAAEHARSKPWTSPSRRRSR